MPVTDTNSFSRNVTLKSRAWPAPTRLTNPKPNNVALTEYGSLFNPAQRH